MNSNFLKSPLSVIALITTLLFTSCTSPRDLIESGDYDAAIVLAIRKIKGKSKKAPKHVQVIEEAFRKANRRDLRNIKSLKNENRPENWEKIDYFYKDIEHRQNLIEPLLPLVDKKGYEASFGFIKIEQESIEAKKKSAEYLYNHAIDLMEQYNQTGQKYFARDAYAELSKIDNIYRNYKDKEVLKEKAYNLGLDRYYFKITNRSDKILPRNFERELLSMGFQEFTRDWKAFDLKPAENIQYDYEVNLVINDARVSPQQEKERQFDESKTIEDGKDYVLDAAGNVMKDSLGNDITVPKKVFIKATILEIFQHKDAYVAGNLEIRALRAGNILQSTPVNAAYVFENYASKVLGGDKRALTKETKKRLGNRPLPFPSDEMMLTDAAREFKYKVKRIISDFFPTE